MSAIVPQAGANCPSCGRFVGPLEQCSHCGAFVKKRIQLKYLRLACLLLAILGIALLVYAARSTATPTAKINSIGATMNYAYVRIEGTVTRGPLYDPDTQALRFYIADETGEIQATTFRDVTQQLVAQDKIPGAGDKISVEGSVRVRDDYSVFTVLSADKLNLIQPTPTERNMGDIGHADELRYIVVRGDVREIRQPYQGLTIVTLGDASGELDVAVNSDVEKLYGAIVPFALGDTVESKGIVTYFRDAPQLSLRHPKDFEKLATENTAATITRIGELDATRVDQRIQISGLVTRVSKFSQGMRATIADDTGELTLVLWQNVYGQIANAGELTQGAQVTATGKLTRYYGDFEIQPNRADDVKISAPIVQAVQTPPANGSAATEATREPSNFPLPTRVPTAAAIARKNADLTQADMGTMVIVQGKITRAAEFSQGMRLTLDDGSGTIILLLWTDVLAKLTNRELLQQGAVVRVTGKIDVFGDALEIVPAHATDMVLVAAAIVPTVDIRTVASISTNDLDATVLVQGTVADIADFSAGKYVTLRDASGKIRVTLFKNVLTPLQGKFGVGTVISVRGKVNVFHGNLEIVADEIEFGGRVTSQ